MTDSTPDHSETYPEYVEDSLYDQPIDGSYTAEYPDGDKGEAGKELE